MNRFLMIFFCIGLLCCRDDEKMEALPSNLVLEVNVSNDLSGLVTIKATAENAIFYTIFFGEPGETGMQDPDGAVTHTYSESGTYNIIVRAHSSETDYIFKNKSIEVTLPIEIPVEGYTTPKSYPGMSLVWQDEFNGTALNTTDWTFEIGTGSNGWGNNELEYYLQENTTVENGNLIITARKESQSGSSYTSSRIVTKGKQKFQYGRVDVRAVLPEGQGIWPALWMLGENISSVGWPKCGEIDIMEMIGGSGRENTVYGTIHWDNNNTYASYGGDYSLPTGTFDEKFHVFSIIWTATSITWFMDDVQFHVVDTTPEGLSEFRNEFFFIFNVAVGGNWPGNPGASTKFPQHMIVDYVRVFQN